MSKQIDLFNIPVNPSDIVYTPEYIAINIIN